MKTKSTFHLGCIGLAALAALAPLASSQAAGDSADPFHNIGYLVGEQNAVSGAPGEAAWVGRGAAGPIKSVASETEDTATRSHEPGDKAVAAAATPPTPSYDPDDRNNPPQP
jgi:hypothetical protein